MVFEIVGEVVFFFIGYFEIFVFDFVVVGFEDNVDVIN